MIRKDNSNINKEENAMCLAEFHKLKTMIGISLGEIFKIQKAHGIPCPDDSEIFALQNGIETIIDKYLSKGYLLTRSNVNSVVKILDDQKLSSFKGFYDIERRLKNAGIDRGMAYVIIKFLYMNGTYKEIIEKMDCSHSPLEHRTFN